MYGDDDLDSVLLGGGFSAVHDGYDPFAEGVGEDDRDSDTDDGDTDSAIIYDHTDSFGRLGTVDREVEQNDDRPVSRAGSTARVIGADEQRTREATDAGIGNVRRIADERSGHPTAGVARRTRSEGVASSIGQAAQRIRAEASIPLNADEQRNALSALGPDGTRLSDKEPKPKRIYTRSIITEVPTFRHTSFEAMLMGLRANVNGDWIIQLKVPNEFTTQATSLGKAYGLALDILVTRKQHGESH